MLQINVAANCPNKTCPGEGFVGKDCKCWCKGTTNPWVDPVIECDAVAVTEPPSPVTEYPVTPVSVTSTPGNLL